MAATSDELNTSMETLTVSQAEEGDVEFHDDATISPKRILIDKELLRDDLGLCKLFVTTYSDTIKVTDDKGNGYIFDEEKMLWQKMHSRFIAARVGELLSKLCDTTDISGVDEAEEAEIEKTCIRLKKIGTGFSLWKKISVDLYDSEFESKFNDTEQEFIAIPPYHKLHLSDPRTLYLRTRDDFFRSECRVIPSYFGSEFDQIPIDDTNRWFQDICLGDAELTRYLQVLLGYFLTGLNTEKRFWIFYGPQNNGKTSLLNLLHSILPSDLFKPASHRVFIKGGDRHSTAHTEHLANLSGCRTAYYSETMEGDKLHDGNIKSISGGDKKNVRRAHGHEFELQFITKLILATNHTFIFNAKDEALLSRLTVVPFDAIFTEFPDPNNPCERKKGSNPPPEYALQWILEGAEMYFAHGKTFPECRKVEEATQLFSQSSNVRQFIQEVCEIAPGKETQSSVLTDRYTEWCNRNHKKNVSPQEFKRAVSRLGIKDKRKTAGVMYLDLLLK